MKAYASDSKVQLYGCSALANISQLEENAREVYAAGALECVTAALRAHRGNAGVQVISRIALHMSPLTVSSFFATN